MGLAGLQALQDVLQGQVHLVRQLLRGGRAPDLGGEPLGGAGGGQDALLQAAGWAHGPGVVAHEAAHLAEHGRDGIGGEAAAVLGRVPAVDGLDQAQAGDLLEVLRVLAVGVGLGHATYQRHQALDGLVARSPVARAVIAQQQMTHGAGRGTRGGCGVGHRRLLGQGRDGAAAKVRPTGALRGRASTSSLVVCLPLGRAWGPATCMGCSTHRGAFASRGRWKVT